MNHQYQEVQNENDIELNVQRQNPNPPLRFRKVKLERIFFKEHMDDQFKNSSYPLPENLRHGRNIAIVLAFVEFVCGLLSFGFYDLRRSRVLLVIILLTLLTTVGGLYAKIKLNYCGILAHAMYTVPVIGGFYIYILVDFFLGTDSDSSGGHSGTTILILSSLPLLFIFCLGCYSIKLVAMIDDELESRKKQDERKGIVRNN